MKIRSGFISNSSSCSFILRLDGLRGKQMTVEEMKGYFPPSKFAKEKLSIVELEEIYIALWKISEWPGSLEELYGFTEIKSYKKWKEAVVFNVGQDSLFDSEIISESASRNLYTYGTKLFNTGNIQLYKEEEL